MRRQCLGLVVGDRWPLWHPVSAGPINEYFSTRFAEIASSGVAILLVEQNARISLAMSNRAYVLAMGKNELHGDARILLNNQQVGRLYLGG